MGTQLLEESATEGKVGCSQRGATESVERVAKMEFPRCVKEETKKAEEDVDEEEKGAFEEQREHRNGE